MKYLVWRVASSTVEDLWRMSNPYHLLNDFIHMLVAMLYDTLTYDAPLLRSYLYITNTLSIHILLYAFRVILLGPPWRMSNPYHLLNDFIHMLVAMLYDTLTYDALLLRSYLYITNTLSIHILLYTFRVILLGPPWRMSNPYHLLNNFIHMLVAILEKTLDEKYFWTKQKRSPESS